MRKERDELGLVELPDNVYYGIETYRAVTNFEVSGKKVHPALIDSMVLVKKAAAQANEKLSLLREDQARAIVEACDELLAGGYQDQFVTDALQGGAGTSTNMNVNEVIANLALEKLGFQKGTYDQLHPLNHVNMSQSTNDVYPTALRIAAIKKIRTLATAFADLQEALQEKENAFANDLKLGRTQLMDAVPMMVGQSFGAYARAIGRDRWRIYKVEERLRQINLGGTAIGTGLNAPRKYIFYVTAILQELTGLGLARSDYPIDTTQNMDVFVEVSGLLKSAAVNLLKITNDLRLLASGPRGGFGELSLPRRQAGSTIMPGKVNPVIPEMVAQVAMEVIGSDAVITHAASAGQLELNAFGPVIADHLLRSLDQMQLAVISLREKAIEGIMVNKERALEHVEKSTSLVTTLVHHLGYDEAAALAKEALEKEKTIRSLLLEKNLFTKEELEKILNPLEITSPGIPGK